MTTPVRPDPMPEARDLPGIAAWHAGWAVAAALAALCGRWLGQGVDGPVFFGILTMAVPGLGGLTLLWRDGMAQRTLVLGLWGLAAVVCAMLAGGMTGSLAGFAFLPMAAGLAFGTHRLIQGGVLMSGLAVLAGLIAVWVAGPSEGHSDLAALSALMTLAAFAVALRLSWRARERTLSEAQGAMQRVEAILSSQPGLTLTMDPSGRPLSAYGTPPAALPVDPLFAQGLIAAVHAPDRPAVLSAIERALSGTDTQVRFAPRTALDRRVTLILRRLDEPQGLRLIVQAFDATAQYAREVALDTARADAVAREAGKTRFLANMSHELRTPLNAVLGFADIMRQQLFGPLPDRYGDYATSIHEAGGHLLNLINDVLDVSKIEADRYDLTLEPFDAREVISAAVTLVRLSAEDKGLALAGVLPAEPLSVVADRRALKQIALNLLSNAVKFTPAGGSVTVTAEAIGPYLEIVVADTGVGVAPEDLKRLGRPFEQAGGADQRAMGTGLGLSLVRALAELHGGRMSLDSTLGEGTAVTVRLPVAQVARPALPEGGAQVIALRDPAG